MKKQALESIDNVAIYPMISFAIFGIFFLAMGVYVWRMRKDFVHKMESLPLDSSSTEK